MNLGRAIAYGILHEIERGERRKAAYARLQSDAASRPESTRVETTRGPIWMSPIDA